MFSNPNFERNRDDQSKRTNFEFIVQSNVSLNQCCGQVDLTLLTVKNFTCPVISMYFDFLAAVRANIFNIPLLLYHKSKTLSAFVQKSI